MALTKVQKTGITDNAIDADKIEDGTIVAADIAPGTITNAKLAGSIANDKLANSSITVNGSSVSLGGSVSAGKVSWQAVKTSGFTAVAGEGYFCNTNGGAFIATLPASPSAGDTVAFKDYGDDFGTNALTIARNGSNIQGVANDSEISTDRASVVLVYIDATKGWLYTNESNVADLQTALYITATGGTVTESGDFKIHSFTGDGCFAVSQLGNPAGGPSTVDYLVVAGGGSGGTGVSAIRAYGGGGAGGYRESKDSTVSSPHTASPLAATTGLTITATTYPVTVGGGGAPSPGVNDYGRKGSDSIFSTITSTGGGAGGGPSSPQPTDYAGGSGGGGGWNGVAATPGSPGNTPPVSPPQGNSGGNGTGPDSGAAGGGGGGAGGAGSNSSSTNGGPGGNGTTTSIDATPTTRAGGGGGAGRPGGSGGSGGPGGGGAGGITTGTAGSANTGGGGGGTSQSSSGCQAGAGGKGIVIIRYKFQN